MPEIRGTACYTDLETGLALTLRVGFTEECRAGHWLLRSARGRVAHCPQEVVGAVAGDRAAAVVGLQLFCGPNVADRDLSGLRVAGFPVHRLTLADITQDPTGWYGSALGLYRASHPLRGEGDWPPLLQGN